MFILDFNRARIQVQRSKQLYTIERSRYIVGAQLDGKATSVSDAITFKKKDKMVIPIRESMRFKLPIDDLHPPYFPTNTCSPPKNSRALLTKKL